MKTWPLYTKCTPQPCCQAAKFTAKLYEYGDAQKTCWRQTGNGGRFKKILKTFKLNTNDKNGTQSPNSHFENLTYIIVAMQLLNWRLDFPF